MHKIILHLWSFEQPSSSSLSAQTSLLRPLWRKQLAHLHIFVHRWYTNTENKAQEWGNNCKGCLWWIFSFCCFSSCTAPTSGVIATIVLSNWNYKWPCLDVNRIFSKQQNRSGAKSQAAMFWQVHDECPHTCSGLQLDKLTPSRGPVQSLPP